MSEPIIQKRVPQSIRIELIQLFPCFSHLSTAEIDELALLMEEVAFNKQAVIVSENDIVDSIYLIVDGEAEVTKETEFKKKKKKVPVAKLRVGDSIGLNDSGFYSETGKRTATVTAISPMLLLKLDLKALASFLKKNNLEDAMFEASSQMLRMLFIKQSLPFSNISPERLRWLADMVEEITIPAGSMIFKEGEEGDKCYLIRTGAVEIFSEEEGVEKQLALLKPPVLFGEATLITHAPRNASARAINDTQLFMLRREHLTELIESEDRVAKMFMTLMIDRSRPIQSQDVEVHKRLSSDKQEITILKNVINEKYFKLSTEGDFIWTQLDGKHTLQEITMELAQRYNLFAPDMVVALISKLTKGGFIKNVKTEGLHHEIKGPLWVQIVTKMRSILEFRYAFGDSDRWVTKLYDRFIRYFFTKPAQLLFAILIVTGAVAFISSTKETIEFFNQKHISLFLLTLLIPLSLAEAMLHELGHAFAVKSFGREVHYIGIGWYWLTPIAFTDTSDMWLATRKPRMIVNLAGVYVDVLIAGIASLLILLIPNPYIQCTLWLFALYTYIGGFRMLSPLQEMDGYYVLMDWVEKNRLQQSAVLWLVKFFPKCLRQPRLFGSFIPEIIFWVAVIIYLVLVTLLTFVIQALVFDVLNIKSNPYLSLLVPFGVLALTSLSIIAEIRKKAEND